MATQTSTKLPIQFPQRVSKPAPKPKKEHKR
jgi:hypothetical protein